MVFVESANSQELDNWLTKNNASYLQSSLWQRILLAIGQKVERIEYREKGEILAAALLVYKPLPFGWQYAFCPKGPVIQIPAVIQDDHVKKIYQVLLDYLHEKKCIFLRCEPEKLIAGLSWEPVKVINPNATLLLDIQSNIEQLFAGMHSKTRYNIRVAERKNLQISTEKNFSVFWELLKRTGQRDNFILHPEGHYKKVMADEAVRQITIFTSDGQPIASGGFIGFGDRYYYLYGALDYGVRQYMAPYLLQWTAIQQAQQLGYKYYDFFGIAPEQKTPNSGEKYLYDPHHQYAGITRFKLGFGGVPKQAPGTFDLIIAQKKYRLYTLARKWRKML